MASDEPEPRRVRGRHTTQMRMAFCQSYRPGRELGRAEFPTARLIQTGVVHADGDLDPVLGLELGEDA
jgi:hypothetical protein